MAEGSEVLEVTCPVTIILNFYVLDKETTQCSSAQREEPEEDENVSALESSQEVGGNNRDLNFLFMPPRTRSGRISY